MSNGGLENLSLEDQQSDVNGKPRRLFLMRHGERVDFTFTGWIMNCFDKNGTYKRIDLNMPKTVPQRSKGPDGFFKDSPLTNIGVFQATKIGEGLKEKKLAIDYAYASPSLRCIQTCDGVLRGCNKQDLVKIRIEPGLFEWGYWYQYHWPDFMTSEELIAAGFNIDTTYEPTVKESELKQGQEECDKYYQRNTLVAKTAANAHPNSNILLVGHSATLEVCSRELLGGVPRSRNDMLEIIRTIPYCGLAQLVEDDGTWIFQERPCLPLTHLSVEKFDQKIFFD